MALVEPGALDPDRRARRAASAPDGSPGDAAARDRPGHRPARDPGRRPAMPCTSARPDDGPGAAPRRADRPADAARPAAAARRRPGAAARPGQRGHGRSWARPCSTSPRPRSPRRGAAAAAGRELAAWPDPPSAADLLRRHGLLRAGGAGRDGRGGPARSRWRGTGSPTRTLGRPARAAGQAVAAHAGATRWPSACRPRRPAPRSACPTARWSRRWPWVSGDRSGSRTVTCGPPGHRKSGTQ